MIKKESLYSRLTQEIEAVLEGEDNEIAKMASISCLLFSAFDDFYWAGFYLVDSKKPRELVVGPYQGTLGCLRISFDRGVCGAAAHELKTQIVKDVNEFGGHIACDPKTKSEITLPVFNQAGDLIAVFDVDSTVKAAFDQTDQFWLEKILVAQFSK